MSPDESGHPFPRPINELAEDLNGLVMERSIAETPVRDTWAPDPCEFPGSPVGRKGMEANGHADDTWSNQNPQRGLDSNQVHVGSVTEPSEAHLSFLQLIDSPVRADA